jgi:uncharacterized protein (DUF2252 family)
MAKPRALPNAEYLPEPTAEERAARGKALRKKVPLESHGEWSPRKKKRGDPVKILERQSADREPDLVPIRFGRMSASPFAFFRGGAALMAADLAHAPRIGLQAQLCGDAHLMNFGLFETPERALIFGLNDFDETLPGPFEWDVKRLATSMEIAARDLDLSHSDRSAAVLATLRAYREGMAEFADMRDLEVFYARLPAADLQAKLRASAGQKEGKEVERQVHKSLKRDHLRAFDKLLRDDGGEFRFVSEPPLLVPAEGLLNKEQRGRYVDVVRSFLKQYRAGLAPHVRALMERYKFVQMARKVVGIGSVGLRTWVVLFIGRDSEDPLLLQLKEAKHSVLEPYTAPRSYDCQGHRVVDGQRFMQVAADPLLGWYHLRAFDGKVHDYYARQLWDGKVSFDLDRLSPAGLRAYGEACGWTLARGHARSGDRIAMAGYLGNKDTFDKAVAKFAVTYAEVNEDDHRRLLKAIKKGRVKAQTGV